MKATLSDKKKRLIRQFHIVCTKNGIRGSKKEMMYESMGIESSTELTEAQLDEVIRSLVADGDKWRKRVLAAIFSWCKDINLNDYDTERVISIACRAAGYKSFEKIPVSRLRNVYYEFVRKSRTTATARDFKEAMVNYMETRN